ncbi:hypothetical protein TNCV_4185201 [Trichonephila clavipes]|nr:hypothetical protein TNCV_4185201 [Trichonephila clavipes]
MLRRVDNESHKIVRHSANCEISLWKFCEKSSNRLVLGPDCMVDALKLLNRAPRVSGESLQTSVACRCPDGTQHLLCWPTLVNR